MRQLLKEEKEIIKELIEARKTNHYENMQFAYILRNRAKYDYLKWDISESKTYLETYCQKATEKEREEIFYRIVDLVGFFEELEKHGYVLIEQLNHKYKPYPRYHFDRDKFKLDETFGVMRMHENGALGTIKDKGDVSHQYFGQIVSKIENFMDSIIYPMRPLSDFATDFKSIEQRRSDKSLRWAKISIIVAIIIGVLSIIGSVISIMLQIRS